MGDMADFLEGEIEEEEARQANEVAELKATIKALRAELAEKGQQILTQVNTMSEQAYKIGELTGENDQLRKQLEEARKSIEVQRNIYTFQLQNQTDEDGHKLLHDELAVIAGKEAGLREALELIKFRSTKPPQETQERHGAKARGENNE